MLTVGFSDKVTRLFSTGRQPLAQARNLGLLALELWPAGKRWFARQAMGLGTRP
ncbi:2-octaprenyl-6-methoxyphenyl hydroxylase [compost metagenome]